MRQAKHDCRRLGTSTARYRTLASERILHVVKLGGSLLDLPDLPQRFETLRRQWCEQSLLIVVGGGRAADLVRDFDRRFRLDETQGHWLAVRAMQLNTHLFASIVPDCRIVANHREYEAIRHVERIFLIDPLTWLEHDEAAGVAVPHCWTFTSDSIAAHLAARLGAARLTLLKSALPPDANNVQAASACGLVDEQFAETAAAIPSIELINLRANPHHA
jgi:aspartokinase-like uncharacterized kinase